MRSDVPNLPEHVPALPLEARAAPPPDDPVAAQLRGFGPLGLLAVLVIVLTSVVKPLGGLLVLLWAWRSHTPWRDIGYVRPRSWLGSLAVGIVFGCALKLLLKAIVMPLLGAPEINSAYHYVIGNRAALPGLMFTMIVGAGFGEETIFRGFLFERLGKLFGTGTGAKVSDRPAHLRGVCPRPLRQSRASRRRTGDDHGSRLRDDLRRHGPDLDGDVRACCVRSHGHRDNLLESRSRCGSPRVQIAAMFNNTLQSSYRKPLTMHERARLGTLTA